MLGVEPRVGVTASACTLILGGVVAWNPFGLSGFHDVKATIGVAALVLGLYAVVLNGTVRFPPFSRLMVGVLMIAGVSALVSGDFRTAVIGYPERHAGLVLFLVLAGWAVVGSSIDPVHHRYIGYTFLVAGVVLSVAILLQSVSLGPFNDVQLTGGRPTGTFGSAAFSGAALVIALPFTWWIVMSADRWSRRIGFVSCALMLAALTLTGARAAWIGFVASAVVFAVRADRRRVILGIAAVCAGCVGLVTATSAGVRERFASLFDPSAGTAGGRLALWRAVPDTVLGRWPLGWGPDRTRVDYPLNLPADFERRFEFETIPDRAHNALFDVAIWIGVPGAVLLTVFIVLVVRKAVQEEARCHDRLFLTAVLASLVAFAGHLAFNFVTFELDPFAALLFGVLAAHVSSWRNVPIGLVSFSSWTTPVLVTGVLVVGGSAVISDVNAKRAVAAEAAGDAALAGRLWRSANESVLQNVQFVEARVRFSLRTGDYVTAIAAADHGVKLHRDPFTEELAAQARLQAILAGQLPITSLGDVRSRYTELSERWPTRSDNLVGLGVVHALDGETDWARDAFIRALGVDPDNVVALENLLRIEREEGRASTVLPLIDRALEHNPSDERLQELKDLASR